MSIEVELPDGSTIEFPDDTTPDVMAKAAKAHWAKVWKPTQRSVHSVQHNAAEYRDRHPVTDDMGTTSRVFAGAGKSLHDSAQGVGQLTGFSSQEDVDRSRRTDDALMNTPGGIVGNFAGSVGQVVAPGGLLLRASKVPRFASQSGALTTASRAFLPQTIKGAAASGAVIGATQPVATGESRMANTALGATFGAAGAGAPRALGWFGRKVTQPFRANTVTGVDRQVGEVLRREAEDAARLARPQPSAIPGVQRTLAEETLDPGIARLERHARSTGQGFDPLDRANNAARVAAIERFAGNDTTRAAAVKARDAASTKLKSAALRVEGVDTSRLVSQVKRLAKAQEGRPAVQSGLRDIAKLLTRPLSEAERKKAALGPLEAYVAADRVSATNREAAKEAMTLIRTGQEPAARFVGASAGTRGQQASKDAAMKALAESRKEWRRTSAPQDRVAVLNKVREHIGDLLSGKSDSKAALAGSRELIAARNQLDRVLAKNVPEYAQYLDAFRKGSEPINRMDVGQELLTARSGSAILDSVTGKQVLTPAAFSRNARGLDQIAAQATGFRKAKAANILKPEDMRTISAVQDDLERKSFAATAGSGGNSHTFERGALDKRLVTRVASKLPFVGAAFAHLDEVGQRRLHARLAEVLANPSEARAILAKLPANDRRLIEDALSRAGGVAGAGVVPALK